MRLLIVDDEELNRDLLERMVQRLGHDSIVARDGMEALVRVREEVDLVLLDVTMPGIDGFEVTRRIRSDARHGDVPIVMVTAHTDRETRLRAVEAGANDFIAKPVDRTELRLRTASLLKMKAAQDALKRHQAELEDTVERRTADLRRALEEIAAAQRKTEEAHLDTVDRLALAAECRDGHTAAHIHRVSHYCATLARELGRSLDEIETIRHASSMHDVGKIGTPDSILLKPGPLTPEERAIMQQHTLLGARILQGSTSKLVQAGETIALSHHEKWDGNGYPYGLAGEKIPLYGRICAVADVFDALTSVRPYKRALPNEQAYEILLAGRGTQFEPRILDHFFARLDEITAIQERFRDDR